MMYKQKLPGKPVILFGGRVDGQDCRFQPGGITAFGFEAPRCKQQECARYACSPKNPRAPSSSKKGGRGIVFIVLCPPQADECFNRFFRRVTPGLNAGT